MNNRLQQVEADEKQLTLHGVPPCYWVYLAHNGCGDGLGMWTWDREWILKDMETVPNSLTYNAVDGRDMTNILKYIDRSWRGHGCIKTGTNEPWAAADSEMTWNEWLVTAKLKCL
jgi:hypothetical protein